MRRVKLSDERGRVVAGLGGIIAIVGAVLIATAVASTDTPAGRVPAAEASHNTVTQEYLESLPNGSKVLLCHTEGNGTQHSVESAVSSVINAGHFNASGSPLHFAGDAHDFIMTITIKGGPGEEDEVEVINEETCGPLATETPTNTAVPPTNTAVPTNTSTPTNTPEPTNTATPSPTATLPIATATQQIESTATPTATPTSTATATPTSTPDPTGTPTATSTQPIATSTQQVQASSTPTRTPTNTPVTQASNTPVPPTNTPVPPAPTNTSVPLVAQVQSVQVTPPPVVRALPSTGNGGYEDNSMSLILGIALVLTGSTLSLAAMKRRAQ